MRAHLKITFILMALFGALDAVSAETNLVNVPKVAIANLLAHKEAYRGKRVEVSGYYISGFECSRLSQRKGERSEDSLWISWGVKPGFEKKVKWLENGNVRVLGKFDFNKWGSGHLNSYGAEIGDLELFEAIK